MFLQELLILTVTGFSDLHSASRQSTHAIISVTSYLVGWGWGGRYSLRKSLTPLSALPAPPPFLCGSTPMQPITTRKQSRRETTDIIQKLDLKQMKQAWFGGVFANRIGLGPILHSSGPARGRQDDWKYRVLGISVWKFRVLANTFSQHMTQCLCV